MQLHVSNFHTWLQASLIGSSADIPLAIPAADMVYGKLLHLGPQSTVHQVSAYYCQITI